MHVWAFSFCQLLLFLSISHFTSHLTSHSAFIEPRLSTCTWLQCQSTIRNVEHLYIACKLLWGTLWSSPSLYKILLTNSSLNSGIGKFASVDELVCFLFLENDSPVIHHIVSLLQLLRLYALRLGLVMAVSLR